MRSRLEEQAAADPTGLYAELKKIDPPSAAKIHPNDLRRIVRALEVYKRTGEPISRLQRKAENSSALTSPLISGLPGRDRNYMPELTGAWRSWLRRA